MVKFSVRLKHPIKVEPVALFTALHLAFNSVQFFAISMPNWLHGTILTLSSITGALAARRKVVPQAVIPSGVQLKSTI